MIGKICFLLYITIGGYAIVESKFCKSHTPTLEFIRNLGKEAFCVFVKFSNDDFRMAFESKICSDGAKVKSVYCGVGACNWFGRKCDGGCIKSGQTTPPENCDDIFNKRDEILKQYEYCTLQVKNESSTYGLSKHGGLFKSYTYKKECITTCAMARIRYEDVRYNCNVDPAKLVQLEILSLGTMTPIVSPALVQCAVVENYVKRRMFTLCDD